MRSWTAVRSEQTFHPGFQTLVEIRNESGVRASVHSVSASVAELRRLLFDYGTLEPRHEGQKLLFEIS